MTLRNFAKDQSGTAAVEFGMTAPAFFAMIFVLVGVSRVIWIQVGIQHASDMAARCRGVNTTLCGTVADTQTYAATHSLGLGVPASSFSVATAGCGVQVTANYTVTSITGLLGLPSVTLTGQSCFPT